MVLFIPSTIIVFNEDKGFPFLNNNNSLIVKIFIKYINLLKQYALLISKVWCYCLFGQQSFKSGTWIVKIWKIVIRGPNKQEHQTLRTKSVLYLIFYYLWMIENNRHLLVFISDMIRIVCCIYKYFYLFLLKTIIITNKNNITTLALNWVKRCFKW